MENTPLRAAGLAIVFIDLQDGIVALAATADPQRLRMCVAALAELAVIFSLPVVVTSVPTTSGAVAPTIAEVRTRHPHAPHHVRTTAGALDDPALRTTLEGLERRTLIIAGVATEVAVALTALAARRLGYEVIVAADACGGIHARSEAAAFAQFAAHGIAVSSAATLAAELAGDFTTDDGRAAMRVLQSLLSAPGHRHAHADHEHD